MKTFKQFISEAGVKPSGVKTGKGFVKGWTLKNKIHTSTTNFDDYHIKQVVNKSSKFGLNDRKILKIISDAYPDAPKEWPKEYLKQLQSGASDNDVYIEEYLNKKGYCMFVIDKAHGSVKGWDEKSCRLGAKALDDKYLPFEVKGFKLFEVKPIKGRPKYITSKYEWYEWLEGKKAGKRTEIGATMAQFREEYITELFDKPYKWRGGGVSKGVITPENPMKVEEFRFITDDGGTIEVLANHWWMDSAQAAARGIKEGHSIIIEFIKTRKGDDHRSTYDMTGEGDAMKIMATVLDIIKSIIKKHKPMTITFSADKTEGFGPKEKKTGRAGAYGAIVKRFAGKLGYKSVVSQAPSETKWQLIKK